MMYGQHTPLYYDKLKKCAITQSQGSPHGPIEGITINQQELKILANSHHSTSIPPMCVWYRDRILLTSIEQNQNLGFMVIPRHPTAWVVKYLTHSRRARQRTDNVFGKFLKYKNYYGKYNTLRRIIRDGIIKRSVDGVCEGVCMYDEGARTFTLRRLRDISTESTTTTIPPMCVWTRFSILLLSRYGGDYYIYKIPRNPTDFHPDYIKVGA